MCANKKKISLSIVLPCYNEEGNVEKLVKEVLNFLPEVSSDYEIIVVNDGSKDKTAEIVEKISKKNSSVRLISHEANKGYGAALSTGFMNSRKDYIFFTDGDNQFNIKELSKFMPYVEDYDIVAGFRIKRRDNFMRLVNAKSFNMLLRILFGLRIKDLNCAFKIFKRKVIESVTMESSGAFINAEILISAFKLGYKMKEIGVNHYPRKWGAQTGANIRVVLRAFYELFKLRKRLS